MNWSAVTSWIVFGRGVRGNRRGRANSVITMDMAYNSSALQGRPA